MRTNPRAQPICNPCYNSQRAISVAASKDPQAKAIMDKYRIADPEGWKAKVRACRICEAGDPRCSATGVPDAKHRKMAIVTSLNSITQSVAIAEIGGVAWKTRGSFISWALNERLAAT